MRKMTDLETLNWIDEYNAKEEKKLTPEELLQHFRFIRWCENYAALAVHQHKEENKLMNKVKKFFRVK